MGTVRYFTRRTWCFILETIVISVQYLKAATLSRAASLGFSIFFALGVILIPGIHFCSSNLRGLFQLYQGRTKKQILDTYLQFLHLIGREGGGSASTLNPI